MGMTPDQFFAFVEGNYEDCDANPDCIRRAFNAAVSASHLADNYYKYHKANNPLKVKAFHKLGDFVKHVAASTDDCFKDIRSISNAYKHLYTSTDPKWAAESSISSAGAIESIDLAKCSKSISMIEGDATRVVFTRKDGQRLEFLPVLKKVVDYWAGLVL